MTQSSHNLYETVVLLFGMLALIYSAMLSAGVITQKDVRLSPAFERKKIVIVKKGAQAPFLVLQDFIS